MILLMVKTQSVSMRYTFPVYIYFSCPADLIFLLEKSD